MADLDLLQEQATRKGLAEMPEALEVYEKETPRITATLASAMVPGDPYGTYQAYKKGGIEEAAKNLGMNLLLHAVGFGTAKLIGKGVQTYKGAKAARLAAAEAAAEEAAQMSMASKPPKPKDLKIIKEQTLADPEVQKRLQQATRIKAEQKAAEEAKTLEKAVADKERMVQLLDDEIAETEKAFKGQGMFRDEEPEILVEQLKDLKKRREALGIKKEPKVFEMDETSKLSTKEIQNSDLVFNDYEDINNDIREIDTIINNLEEIVEANPQVQQSINEAYNRKASLVRELGRLEKRFPGLGSGGKVNAVVPPMFLPLVLGQSNKKKK